MNRPTGAERPFHVAILGDSHFDASANGRLDECIRVHAWIVGDARSRGARAFLHTGDLYEHRHGSTPEERQAAADFVTAAANVGPVVIVRGNHDRPGDLAILERLQADNPITVLERPQTVYLYVQTPCGNDAGGVDVTGLPWPETRSIIGAAQAAGWTPTEADDQVREALRWILRHGAATLTEKGDRVPTVLVAHAMVDGSVTSTGQPLVGVPMNVPLELLDEADADLVALGHVHKPQEWERPGRAPVVYTGSPRRTSFGEMEEKSYTLATFAPDGSVTWRRIPVPCQPMIRVAGEWDAETSRVVLPLVGADNVGDHVQHWDGADVRVDVAVPAGFRGLALEQLESAAAVWMAAEDAAPAAVSFSVTTQIVQTARAPVVREHDRIADKLEALRALRGETLDDAHTARLAALVDAYAEKVGRVSPRTNAAPALRVTRVRGACWGSLNEFDVDLAALPGPVVGVSGMNGSGKSTFLGLIRAAAERTVPGYGSLRSMASGASSFLEVEATGRAPFRLLHRVEGAARRSESMAFVVGADGTYQPALPDSKVKTFDDWAASNMPHPDIWRASTFSEQRSRGFLASTPAERRDVILQALGLERVNAIAALARADATTAEAYLAAAVTRLEDAEAGLEIETAKLALSHAERAVQDRAEARASFERSMAGSREAVAAYQRAWSAFESARHAARSLESDVDAQQRRTDELAARLARLDQTIANRERVERAVAEKAALVERLDGLRDAIAVKGDAASAARAEWMEAANDATRKEERLTTLRRLQESDAIIAGERATVEAAVARVAQLDTEIGEADREMEDAARDLDQVRANMADPNARRVGVLRGGLERIVEDPLCLTFSDAQEIAAGALSEDGSILASVTTAGDVDRQRERMVRASKRQQDLRNERTIASAKAQRAPVVAAAAAAVEERRPQLELLEQEVASLKEAAAVKKAEHAEADRAWGLIASEGSGINEAIRRIPADVLALAPRLEDALRERPEVAAELERSKAILDEKKAAQAAHVVPPEPSRPDVTDAEALDLRLEALRQDERKAIEAQSAAVARLAAQREKAERVEALIEDVRATESDLADRIRIAQECGRKGLQGLEIDAAGPALSQYVNTLLGACVGDRFRVEFVTERPAADDPDKMLEVYEIHVHDNERGRVDVAHRFSGGEQTLVSEAIALGLTVLACERSQVGDVRPTIVRDESGAALDVRFAPQYVAMLRRAVEIIGADRVLLVSHDDAVLSQCDTVLQVAGGTVRVPE